MTDYFYKAVGKDSNIVIAMANTTDACHSALGYQHLETTSLIALGRLLTAASLTGLLQNRPGSTSMQVVGNGRLGQVYADVTPAGDLRGYVTNPTLSFPPQDADELLGRRSIRAGIGEGKLSVIRMGNNNQFNQSTTPIISGELDTDVAYFVEQSDQIPTYVRCEILLDEHGKLLHSFGVMVHSMPDTVQERMEEISGALEGQGLATIVKKFDADPQRILGEIAPNAAFVGENIPLRWHCRCSLDRVLAALPMLGAAQLADMVANKEQAEVSCDFCGKQYAIESKVVAETYQSLLVGNN